MPIIRLSCLFLSILLLLCVSSLQAASPSLKRLAVVSVTNETKDEQFGDLLIIQGIANLVTQELYNTGSFIPVEEKREIRAKIDELLHQSTQAPAPASDQELAVELDCDVIGRVVIKKFKKRRSRGFAGPFSSSKTKVIVEVEIILHERGHHAQKASGKGTGITKAAGVLFQIRQDKIHFDETTAGQAVMEAVQQAVTNFNF